MAAHKFSTKERGGEIHISSCKTRINREFYALWSACKSCAPVRFMLYMSGNISGVPFNNVKPTLSGRIEGGSPVPIEQHPHQVKLLNCC